MRCGYISNHMHINIGLTIGINMAGFPKASEKRGNKAKRPHAGVALDPKVIAELIHKYAGNVSAVADAMGSARGCISRVIDKHPDLQDLLRQARERQLDELESTCFQDAIETRDTALRCFILKTQGRHRGWDQDESKHQAKEVANAAFEFILSKTKQA